MRGGQHDTFIAPRLVAELAVRQFRIPQQVFIDVVEINLPLQQFPRHLREGVVDAHRRLRAIDGAFHDRRRIGRPHRRFRIQDGDTRITPPLPQQSAQPRRVGVQRRDVFFVEILPTIITCEVIDAHGEMPVDGCADPFDANLAVRHPRRMVGKFRERLLLAGNIRK